MPRKRFTAEEIIHKLREAEVLLAQGSPGGASAAQVHFRYAPAAFCS